MKKRFTSSPFALLCIVIPVLLTRITHAGSFSTDFNSGTPGGSSVYGNTFVDASGGVGDSGVLKLTTAANSQSGSFIIDDLDPGLRASSYLVTFKLRMGGGTAVPADGISFNFATDLPNAVFNEEGAGSGLTITFDAYDNGTGDNPEGPELRIKYAGAPVANRKLSNQLRTGANFVDVLIRYNTAGTLDVVNSGVVMFTNLSVAGPLPTGARFGFGARTGGLNQDQFIDDLNITTTPVSRFYVKGGTLPSPPVGVASDAVINVSLQDSGATVDPSGITMTLNGDTVSPLVSKPAGITTIQYDPPGSLLYNSLNRVVLTIPDSGGPPATTLQYDFAVASAPMWSLAPGSRSYISTDASSTPFQRSIAYNSLSNHLYVISRTGPTTGLTVNVLDATTGADLYQLNTTGISGGSIILVSIAVADDGAIYACNVTTANTVIIYRWANDNSSTVPSVVFSVSPAPSAPSNTRWGDTLAAGGAGANTQLILDPQNNVTTSSILAATDSYATNFTATPYNHTYSGTVIGRSLQFGPTNTFLLKKKSSATPPASQPLQLLRYDSAPSTTALLSMPDFHGQLGQFTVDFSKNLGAGIFYSTNSSATTAPADRLIVYDVSNLSSPLQIASYNFPTNHQANANFIAQIVFGGDKIFAVEGNNGIIAVPAVPPVQPRLELAQSNNSVVLSWTNSVPGFVLQAMPNLSPPSWTNVGLPTTIVGSRTFVIDDTSGWEKYYRLLKP